MREKKVRVKLTRRQRRAVRLERKRAKEAKRYEEYLQDVQQLLALYKTQLLVDLETEQNQFIELQNQMQQLIQASTETME